MKLGMTVRELLSRTTSAELAEYIAYFQILSEEADRDALRAKAASKNKSRTPRRRK